MKLQNYGLIAGLLVLAGCGGGGASSTPATPNNPATTVVTVSNSAGASVAGALVTLSTSIDSNGSPSGTIISKTNTDAAGQATISLPSIGTLCVTASTGTNLFRQTGQCVSQPFPSTESLAFSS